MWPLTYIIIAGWVAIIFQMALPAFYSVTGQAGALLPSGAEPQFIVLVIVWAGLRMPDLRAFVAAAVLGFSFDLVSQYRLGTSVIPLALITALILSQTKTKLGRYLLYQILLVLVATFLYQTMSYLLASFQLWRWRWPFNIWTIIVLSSLLNAALFSLIKMIVQLAQWWRQRPVPEDSAYVSR